LKKSAASWKFTSAPKKASDRRVGQARPRREQIQSEAEGAGRRRQKHIRHEEERIFKLVREHFGDVHDDLGDRVKKREAALKAGGQIAGSE
jgi:hypothetical protein